MDFMFCVSLFYCGRVFLHLPILHGPWVGRRLQLPPLALASSLRDKQWWPPLLCFLQVQFSGLNNLYPLFNQASWVWGCFSFSDDPHSFLDCTPKKVVSIVKIGSSCNFFCYIWRGGHWLLLVHGLHYSLFRLPSWCMRRLMDTIHVSMRCFVTGISALITYSSLIAVSVSAIIDGCEPENSDIFFIAENIFYFHVEYWNSILPTCYSCAVNLNRSVFLYFMVVIFDNCCRFLLVFCRYDI